MEQTNFGLLEIREYAPILKLLVELWFYILAKFNERWAEVAARVEALTNLERRSHVANLRTFGQWQVLDDGHTQAKVQTTD